MDSPNQDFNYQQLDDIIHSRIRLAVLSVLVAIDEADFIFLREKVGATDGNLSVHLKKLEEAEYIVVQKQFVDKKPQTTYTLTAKGRTAFETYVNRLESMLRGTTQS